MKTIWQFDVFNLRRIVVCSAAEICLQLRITGGFTQID